MSIIKTDGYTKRNVYLDPKYLVLPHTKHLNFYNDIFACDHFYGDWYTLFNNCWQLDATGNSQIIIIYILSYCV